MDAEGKEYRKGPRCVRTIDVDHDMDAVAHRHGNILIAHDPLVLRRPLIIGRRLVACGGELLGGADVVVFHVELDRTFCVRYLPPTITHISSAGSWPVLTHE